MRLAIVGSRHQFSNNPEWQKWAKKYILSIIRKYEPEVVISGGAKGIDSLAVSVARSHGYKADRIIEYRPVTKNWEGYKERDMEIAEDCTHLLAIIHRQSRTQGARWTANYAKEIGKTVFIKEVG